ncbi:MAG: MFS transporter [Hyphomicrobiales bacterium]|nr:MFS transporter [Hyphomicrobiales bacterium]
MVGIVTLSFAYVLSQFYRTFLAVLTPVLSSELAMSEVQLSIASGVWFATFASAQFPIGTWLDRYGPRRTASYMLGLFGAGGSYLFATATDPVHIIIAMGFIGLGCAPILMASYVLLTRNYAPAKFATLASIFVAVGMSGSVVGAEPLAQAVTAWGWRDVGLGLVVISLTISCAILFLVKDPELVVHEKKGSVFDLLKIRQLWPLFALITCSYAIPTSIRALWSGPYLEQIHGLGVLEIGRIVLFLAFAQIAGTIIYGPLDRIFNTRKWVITTGNVMLLLTCIWFVLNPDAGLTNATLALVALSVFGATSAVQLTHGKSYIPAHMTGRGLTLLNFFSIGGVAIMQFTSGIVVNTYTIDTQPTRAFTALFTFYAVYLAISLAIYQFSRDAKPR